MDTKRKSLALLLIVTALLAGCTTTKYVSVPCPKLQVSPELLVPPESPKHREALMQLLTPTTLPADATQPDLTP